MIQALWHELAELMHPLVQRADTIDPQVAQDIAWAFGRIESSTVTTKVFLEALSNRVVEQASDFDNDQLFTVLWALHKCNSHHGALKKVYDDRLKEAEGDVVLEETGRAADLGPEVMARYVNLYDIQKPTGEDNGIDENEDLYFSDDAEQDEILAQDGLPEWAARIQAYKKTHEVDAQAHPVEVFSQYLQASQQKYTGPHRAYDDSSAQQEELLAQQYPHIAEARQKALESGESFGLELKDPSVPVGQTTKQLDSKELYSLLSKSFGHWEDSEAGVKDEETGVLEAPDTPGQIKCAYEWITLDTASNEVLTSSGAAGPDTQADTNFVVSHVTFPSSVLKPVYYTTSATVPTHFEFQGVLSADGKTVELDAKKAVAYLENTWEDLVIDDVEYFVDNSSHPPAVLKKTIESHNGHTLYSFEGGLKAGSVDSSIAYSELQFEVAEADPNTQGEFAAKYGEGIKFEDVFAKEQVVGELGEEFSDTYDQLLNVSQQFEQAEQITDTALKQKTIQALLESPEVKAIIDLYSDPATQDEDSALTVPVEDTEDVNTTQIDTRSFNTEEKERVKSLGFEWHSKKLAGRAGGEGYKVSEEAETEVQQ